MNRSGLSFFAMVALTAGLSMARTLAYAEGKSIAGIVFQQDQYMRGVQIGMERATAQSGDQLLSANSDSKLEKESRLIDTYIARGVDAIVLTPLSVDASMTALKKARDAGVVVVTFGTTVKGDLAQASITSSDADIGRGTGQAAVPFLKELGGGDKVKIGILAFKSLLPEQSNGRVNGFLSEVEDYVDVVSQHDAWLAEKAVALASDILTANPDIQVLYAANEGGTVGAVQAVKRAGLDGKVFVFGTDGSEQLAHMLMNDDNVLQAVTAQQPLEVGRLAIEAAIRLIDGKDVEKEISVPVLPLRRIDPEGVKAFQDGLKALTN